MKMKLAYPLGAFVLGAMYSSQAQARCDSQPRLPDHIAHQFHFCPNDIVISVDSAHIANEEKRFTVGGSRDNLPQRMQYEIHEKNPNLFPFNCPHDARYPNHPGIPAKLEITMRAERVGSENGSGIYKIGNNQHIGFRLEAGDTNLSFNNGKINLNAGQTAQLKFPSGTEWHTACNGLGINLRVTPMLLKAFPVGRYAAGVQPSQANDFFQMPSRIKVADITIRKKRHHPGHGDGYDVTGKTTVGLYLDFSRFAVHNHAKSCSLAPASRNITLNFPTVSPVSFKNQGDLVYGATTRLQLDCSQAGSNVTPYAVLHDVQNPNNRSDVLTIERGNGKAKGVGIKLFKDRESTALRYGPANIAKRLENQFATPENWWKFANKGVRHPSIQLTGYYARTGRVVPGDVRAQATITFSYQ